MRAVIQRVSRASVHTEGKVVAEIGQGLLVLLGVEDTDTTEDSLWLSRKIVSMRIFDDEDGVMNLSISDIDGALIVVSQFTLHADTKKGNRPSYIRAAKPDTAIPLYRDFVAQTERLIGRPVGTGVFGAAMNVELVNNGPVTIIIDSKRKN